MGPAPDAPAGVIQLVPLAGDDESAGTRIVHAGDDGALQLQDVRYPPHSVIEPHAHRIDEIIFVTEGQLHVGAHVLVGGDSLYIPSHTLYGFRSGDDGVRFLLFRGERDSTYLSKEQLLAERRATGA
jgi:quercetin dioxygenase-like cupin family protein